MERINQVGTLLQGRRGAPLRRRPLGVDGQPVVQSVDRVLIQHLVDGVLAVAVDSDQLGQGLGRHAVALNQVAILRTPVPRRRVDHQRVCAFPAGFVLNGNFRHRLAILALRPLEHALFAHHWPLDEGRFEHEQVVQERIQSLVEPTFAEHVVDLFLGTGALRSCFDLGLSHRVRLGIAQQLHDLFLRHGHRALFSLEYQLSGLRQDGLLRFRWEFGHRGRSKQPRFFTL